MGWGGGGDRKTGSGKARGVAPQWVDRGKGRRGGEREEGHWSMDAVHKSPAAAVSCGPKVCTLDLSQMKSWQVMTVDF